MDLAKKFRDDLSQGNIGERIIAKWLKSKGYNILSFNDNMDWDIMVEKDGFKKTIEIKTDRWEYFNDKITDNMFLETRCNGKNSGILGSKADYFIYFYPDHELVYLIRMDEIRKIAQYGCRKAYCADGNKVIGWTINRFEFAHYFKIFNLKKDKVWDKFRKK